MDSVDCNNPYSSKDDSSTDSDDSTDDDVHIVYSIISICCTFLFIVL